MKKLLLIQAIGFLLALTICGPPLAAAQEGSPANSLRRGQPVWFPIPAAMIGQTQRHRIERSQTYLDVARMYGLGFNEIQDLYPADDPWIPTPGKWITIPSQWIIPHAPHKDIVVNVAEMRLYYFTEHPDGVYTFPVGIGEQDAVTPTGRYEIRGKLRHPVWVIPPSLQYKYPVKYFPPGPDNPLGDHWMGLAHTHYGIHGTDNPWSIGRLVTHGCIRMYPEDIQFLYNKVESGTRVRIIYEPVKLAVAQGRVYVEVHKDIYGKIGDLIAYGDAFIRSRGLAGRIDLDRYHAALKRQDGLPVDVTREHTKAALQHRFLKPGP